MTNKISKRIDERRAAKVEYDRHSAHLMTCNNGYQWSGAAPQPPQEQDDE